MEPGDTVSPSSGYGCRSLVLLLLVDREGRGPMFVHGWGAGSDRDGLAHMCRFVHVMHVWLQFRVAYVLRESLVVGCGKLVWDAMMIAEHYVRSVKGFWFDVFVILPVPLDASDLGGDDNDNDDEGKDDEKIVWVDEVLKSEVPIYDVHKMDYLIFVK